MIRLTIPEIGQEEIQAMTQVLLSGYLVQGTHVVEFEKRVSEYIGVKYAVAVSSGTAALHLALLALGIGPGDEVIVPDFTFPATANVVEITGAKAVLVDIDLETFNIQIDSIRTAITPRTRAIIPVHLFGLPANLDSVLDIGQEFNLFVIEDAACALGAEYKGRKCGTFGNMGCFSFHPRKAVTTGEGGMIVTNDESLAIRLRQLRNHGMSDNAGWSRFERAGLNYRMTDFQGALGAVQMERLENIITSRRQIAESYHLALAGIPGLVHPAEYTGARHVWQSYVVLLPAAIDRDHIISEMSAQDVETTIGTYAISAQPYYNQPEILHPNAHYAYQHSLCLPLHTRLAPADVEEIVACLEKALQSAL